MGVTTFYMYGHSLYFHPLHIHISPQGDQKNEETRPKIKPCSDLKQWARGVIHVSVYNRVCDAVGCDIGRDIGCNEETRPEIEPRSDLR